MGINEIVELMMKSSNNNPYSGKLSEGYNIISAIDLAKLCKDFADKGYKDEAMDIDSGTWSLVISELEKMSISFKGSKRLSN